MSNKLAGTLIVILISASIGFFIGQNKIPQSSQSPETCEQTAGLPELPEKEIEEYLQLKDQKAKFEKADELLGKMILLFLAALENKTDRQKQLEEQIKKSGTLSDKTLETAECLVIPPPTAVTSQTESSTKDTSVEATMSTPTLPQTTPSTVPSVAKDSDSGFRDSEFFYRYTLMVPPAEEEFAVLNRTWSARLRVLRERDRDVQLDFLGRPDLDNGVSGAVMLRFTIPDDATSWTEIAKRSRPTKTPRLPQLLQTNELFFVEDERTALQIMYNHSTNKGTGRFFYKNTDGTYSLLGHIQLNRFLQRKLQNR